MRTNPQRITIRCRNTAHTVRARIESSGERLWRLADFDGLPLTAVAQSLSRLSRQGVIERLGKGLYYRPRHTAFGPSRPNPVQLRSLVTRHKGVFPAGTAAANLLGFTTQNPGRIELATDGTSLPRRFLGKDAQVHTRRPPAWRTLSETDAALLDFLRNRGASNELPPRQAVDKLLAYFREPGALSAIERRRLRASPRPGHARGHRRADWSARACPCPAATQLESALPF